MGSLGASDSIKQGFVSQDESQNNTASNNLTKMTSGRGGVNPKRTP